MKVFSRKKFIEEQMKRWDKSVWVSECEGKTPEEIENMRLFSRSRMVRRSGGINNGHR